MAKKTPQAAKPKQKRVTAPTMRLTVRETSLILAGLRFMQRRTPDALPAPIFDLLVDGNADDFTADEIDSLCVKLNLRDGKPQGNKQEGALSPAAA